MVIGLKLLTTERIRTGGNFYNRISKVTEMSLSSFWERGRENGSFPGVEILKPQGFKEEQSDDAQIVQWRNASMVRMMSGVRFSLWAQEFVIF